MEKELLGSYRLQSDYSMKGKVRSVLTGWIVFLLLFGVLQIPAVRGVLLRFSLTVMVRWVTGVVEFLLNGLVIVFIPMIIGTVITLMKKQKFTELRLYADGIGFADAAGAERLARYGDVKLSYGKLRQSLWIECKPQGIPLTEYGWKEFERPDELRGNLDRLGSWS